MTTKTKSSKLSRRNQRKIDGLTPEQMEQAARVYSDPKLSRQQQIDRGSKLVDDFRVKNSRAYELKLATVAATSK